MKKVCLIILLALTLSILKYNRTIKTQTYETVYIRADGIIEPSTAPITANGSFYALLTNFYGNIVIEKSNMIIDGQNFTIEGNTAFESKGISIQKCANVTVKNFKIVGFYYGVWLSNAHNNKICKNTFTQCTGRSILLIQSSNNTVLENILIENKGRGILLDNSHDNRLIGNQIIDGGCDAVIMRYSSNNLLSENEIMQNNGRGIWLGYSNNNIIIKNRIFANNYDGISLYTACNNTLSRNTVSNSNYRGIVLDSSHNNTIANNNFIDNTIQVSTKLSYQNKWNYPYPIGGNYWSHIQKIDEGCGPLQNISGSDGIIDNEFQIDEHNIDSYPLMGVLSTFKLLNDYEVDLVSNWNAVRLSYSASNKTLNLLLVCLGQNETQGFCVLKLPEALITPPYSITVNNINQSYNILFANKTLSLIYLNFYGTVAEVYIIPEFNLNHPLTLSILVMLFWLITVKLLPE